MKATLVDYLSKNKHLIPVLFGLITLVMLVLTLIPAGTLGSSAIWTYDKLGHLLMFGVWTFLLGAYLYISNSYTLKLFTIFFIGVAFGIMIEVLQYLLPFERSAELFDITFDSLGTLLGVISLKALLPEEEETAVG